MRVTLPTTRGASRLALTVAPGFVLVLVLILILVLAVSLATSDAFAQDPTLSRLADKAEREGTVRVIARVPVNFQAEARLSRFARGRQRSAVASAQANLAQAVQRGPGLDVVESIEALPLVVLEADREGLDRLRRSRLEFIEDTLSAPYLDTTVALIGAARAHRTGLTGAGQTIAVLDTGVDTSHPMFEGKTVAEACYSTTSSANGGSTSFCPGDLAEEIGEGAGGACSQTIAGCDHGTHVAGIALGDGSSIDGVAPGASLVAIQVFSRFSSAATCSPRFAPCALSYTSDQIKALQHVVTLAERFDIAAVNMSLGGGRNAGVCDADPRKPAIDALRSLGIATVAASGNNGFTDGIGSPACISSAISVGASDDEDEVAEFSNTAPILDMFAPGEAILSAVPGGEMRQKRGTSMAAPHVAGAIALAFQKDPEASVDDVIAAILSNGVDVSGRDLTRPRLALEHLTPRDGAPLPVRPPETGPAEPRPMDPPPAVALGPRGPIAFGTLWYDGAVQAGTGNFEARFDATALRYEIAIDGEDYHFTRYVTMVTPAGDHRRCRASSAEGMLIVECADGASRPALSRFAFVTYRIGGGTAGEIVR